MISEKSNGAKVIVTEGSSDKERLLHDNKVRMRELYIEVYAPNRLKGNRGDAGAKRAGLKI